MSRETPPAAGAVGPIRRLRWVAKPHRRDYGLAVLFFIVKDSPVWILPLITAAVVDAVVTGAELAELAVIGTIGLVVLLQNYPMNMMFVRFSSRATRSLAFDLRERLTEHLQRIQLSFHRVTQSSVIQTKVVRDVENVELMIQQSLPIALSSTFSLLGALAMTALNVPLFLLVFIVVVPLAIALVIGFRRKSRSHNESFRTQVEKFSAEVEEMSTILPLARAHALEAASIEKVQQSASTLRSRGIELDRLNGKFGALTWLSYQVLGLVALIAAAALGLSGLVQITPGQVVLVASYFAVLMGNAIGLLNIMPIFARGLESLRSIGEILENSQLDRHSGRVELKNFSGAVAASKLTIRLGGKTILKDVDVEIAPGEFVAFVGPSGSGKTTLAHSLLGLIPPAKGTVRFDGVESARVDLKKLRRSISLVTQEPVLMNSSLRANVTFGLPEDDQAVISALLDAQLPELATEEALDLGMNLELRTLSVGQKQRIAFARAIYRRPRLLVLDEATSALDTVSESALIKTLDRVRGKVSIVVIAHRLRTVRRADRIYYLEDGRVREVGTHKQLMALRSGYYKLVKSGDN